MVSYKIILFLGFLFVIPGVFAATDLLSCSFKSSCSADESAMLYANEYFHNGSGTVLSSNVALTNSLGYNKPLCCRINPSLSGLDLGRLNVTYVSAAASCPTNFEGLMYLTSNNNARVGVAQNITNITNFQYKMCVGIPTQFSKLNILVSTNDYSFAGYTCLYRINNITNGLISDCSARFNGVSQYRQIVWAKLTENTDSLKCNLDCTSKLDGRVYSACGSKIPDCAFVSPQCDGSVFGAYVKDSSGNYEIQCSSPWTNVRNLAFTNQDVEVVSVNNKCSNIIQTKYSAMLNNELVNMMVYVCQD